MSNNVLEVETNNFRTKDYCHVCYKDINAGDPYLSGIEGCCGGGCYVWVCLDCTTKAAEVVKAWRVNQSVSHVRDVIDTIAAAEGRGVVTELVVNEPFHCGLRAEIREALRYVRILFKPFDGVTHLCGYPFRVDPKQLEGLRIV